MREIKFRGKTPDGKTIYGSYVPFDYANFGVMVGRVFNDFQTYIEHHRGHGIMDEQGKIHAVIQESVQQFCGVDSNGDEVYEGDAVIDDYGNEYIAECIPSIKLPEDAVEVVGSYYLNEDFPVYKK